MKFKRTAYTLIEIMIVVTIILILAGSHQVPNALRMRMVAEETVCDENQRLLRDATLNYMTTNHSRANSFDDLIDNGLIAKIPDCPSGGVYSWGVLGMKLDQNKIICSIHGEFPEEEE